MKIEHKMDLTELTVEVLRDLARNESASREMREAAAELLFEKSFPFDRHSDLRELFLTIKARHEAKKEVQATVDSALSEANEIEEIEEISEVPAEPVQQMDETEGSSEEFRIMSEIWPKED